MQMQLGLMPGTAGQQPMGVPLNQPPPPPQIPHPGEASQQAAQQQQNMMQQSMQMAQMTRYAPPPSAPSPGGGFSSTWGASLGAMTAGQSSPYMAQAMGGMPGMPGMGMMTAPQFGGYRAPPMGGGFGFSSTPHVPTMPFSPQTPPSHFMTPAMQNLQISRAYQSRALATVASIAQVGAGIGGGLLGGAIGMAVGGPVGSMVGSVIGGQGGEGLAGLGIGPAMSDVERGRQMQNTTAPFMIGGRSLDPFTGQGLSRGAGVETARLMRTMTRDHQFQEKTGFNTQDVMRITQLASDQGLLQTAQNPEQIASSVKNISKAVKALVQITGDPDVRNAISSLGQMRNMGFEGLGAQVGAVANRAAFSRMAGVSQAQMQQYEGAGSMSAIQMGLSGAVGVRSAQFGAGMANAALSSGAVSGSILGQIGGQQGFSQILAQAQNAAVGFDPYLMASMQAGGRGIDMDKYRGLRGKSLNDVMSASGSNMGALGPRGLMDFARKRKTLASQAAQQLSPEEQMMLPLEQARALQTSMGGEDQFSLGSAFQARGMDADAATATESMYKNRAFWQTQIQQTKVRQRGAADRERARRETLRTPGGLRRIGRGLADAAAYTSDAIEEPFARGFEALSQINEDNTAFERGESIERYRPEAVVRTERDRMLASTAGRAGGARQITAIMAGLGGIEGAKEDGMGWGRGRRIGNMIGAGLGVERLDTDNRRMQLMGEATGAFGRASTGSRRGDKAYLSEIGKLGDAAERAQRINAGSAAATVGMMLDLDQRLKSSAEAAAGIKGHVGTKMGASELLTNVRGRIMAELPSAWMPGMKDEAFTPGMIEKHLVVELEKGGSDHDTAVATVHANHDALITGVMSDLAKNGGDTARKAIASTLNVRDKLGSLTDLQSIRDISHLKLVADFEKAGITSPYASASENARRVSKVSTALAGADMDQIARGVALASGKESEDALRASDAAAGISIEKRHALNAQAEKAFAALPEDVQKTLREAGAKAGAGAGAMVKGIVADTAQEKFTSAATAGMKETGFTGNAKEWLEKITKGGQEALGDSDAAKALFAAAQKGDVEGAMQAAADMGLGGAEETEVGGGPKSAETRSMDAAIKRFKKEEESLPDTVEGNTTRIMGEAAISLKEAATALNEAATKFQGDGFKKELAEASPFFQGLVHVASLGTL